MKIVIAGAGEVGFHLAKLLSAESQDITLVDKSRERLRLADAQLDVLATYADATSPKSMEPIMQAGCDLCIAVTSSDAANFMIAILGKTMGAKRTLARIGNQEYQLPKWSEALHTFGIDQTFSPQELASNEIRVLLEQSTFNDSYTFDNGELVMLGAQVHEDAPICHKQVADIDQEFPLDFNIVAIDRNQETIVPQGNTRIQAGDQLYFITNCNGKENLYTLFRRDKLEIKHVMIMGAGQIGIKTAIYLNSEGYSVKIIERDPRRLQHIIDILPSEVMVLSGDGRSNALLESEHSDHIDAFVALTGNSETNIMSSLLAKSKGAKKTIALVENMEYLHLSKAIGIDTLINKKYLAASEIVKYIRKGKVLAINTLKNSDAEVLEFEVKRKSKISSRSIMEIKMPKHTVIGGVIRDNEGLLPKGDFRIHEGDHVIVCCLHSSIRAVEKLFE